MNIKATAQAIVDRETAASIEEAFKPRTLMGLLLRNDFEGTQRKLGILAHAHNDVVIESLYREVKQIQSNVESV